MRYDIQYRTEFVYDELVRESQNELRACPTNDERQQLVSYQVNTSPSSRMLSFADYWDTRVDAFGVRGPHLSLEVAAEASVETTQPALFTTSARLEALAAPAFVDAHDEYLQPSPHAAWGIEVERAAQHAVEFANPDVVSHILAIHRFVGTNLTYAPGTTYVGVAVEEVFASQRGVCQDFTHLAVAMCRAVGIPARYVSGYIFTRDDATGADTDDDLVQVQTHAWMEAAVPGVGWLALDPTNQQEVSERHVKIGHGRDYDDVMPLRGVYVGGGSATVAATVEIRRMSPTGAESSSSTRRRQSVSSVIGLPARTLDHVTQQ